MIDKVANDMIDMINASMFIQQNTVECFEIYANIYVT